MNEHPSTIESFTEELSEDLDGEPPEPGVQVSVADQQSTLLIDEAQLREAVLAVFRDSIYQSGAVSIAVVDDPTIHQLNRQFLEHDYPTDVLSFVLDDREPYLEGELVVSADTAVSYAAEYHWSPQSELLLYVIHGALHLVGYRDKEPADISRMRAAEKSCLLSLGIVLPVEWSRGATPEEGCGS